MLPFAGRADWTGGGSGAGVKQQMTGGSAAAAGNELPLLNSKALRYPITLRIYYSALELAREITATR